MNGPAPLCIFDGIMDAPLYVKILDTTLLPFIAHKFPSSHRKRHQTGMRDGGVLGDNEYRYMRNGWILG